MAELNKAQKEQFEYWYFAWPIGFRRALGLVVDWLVLAVFCVGPYFVHRWLDPGFAHQFRSVFDIPGDLSSAGAAVWLLAASVISPIPLINLRVLCKLVWHVATPGELLTGYSAMPVDTGVRALIGQICYGVVQYCSLFISGFFVLVVLVPVELVQIWQDCLKGYAMEHVSGTGYALFSLLWGSFVLSMALMPGSKEHPEGALETFCSQRLVLSRVAGRNNPLQIKEKSNEG